ncbi:MAG: PAS domain-containing sensor histidine kinase [Cyclobacteriaceae bacterium]
MDSGLDLLTLVFTSASEGIIISDTKGTIISANPMAEIMFGYDESTLEGLKIEDLVPDGARQNHQAHRNEYLKNPNPRPMGIGLDLKGQRKDGGIFPLEISLSYFEQNDNRFVAAFINDITERKKSEEKLQQFASHLQEMVKERTQELEHLNLGLKREVMERRAAEQAVRKSQKLYETIAKNFPGGSVSILNNDLEILFIEGNEIGEQDKSKFIGESFIQKLAKGLRDEAKQHLEKCLSGEQTTWHYETENDAYIVHAVPIAFDKNTQVDQILIVQENVTEIKNAEREMRKLLAQERELSEMKSRFVSMASHEFRTPLTTILSSTTLISKYTGGDQQDKRDKHLNRIQSSVKNLTEILNDFLSLEKLDSGALEIFWQKISLDTFVNNTLDELSSIQKQGQEIKFSAKKLEEFVTDEKLLRNILINLTSNAIKYSPENTEIKIDANQDKSGLRIKVIDKGIGIPKQEQTHLFERFFRAKNAFNIQGTGLGLHIVKKYLTQLKGRIEVDSDQGKGTTITIFIPNGKEEDISN